jgi:hypothetical protein
MDMSNDELTPEEREALANLPRERMPSAGLEDRVVAAMRSHGHLARKPARVIRLTTSRVAGLLAACLVLMIGAYSIGLHHGVNDEVLRKVEPERSTLPTESVRQTELGLPPAIQESADAARTEAAPNTDVEKQLEEMKAPEFEPPKLNMPQVAAPKDAKKEKRAKTDEVAESMEKSFSDRLSATDMPVPSAAPMQLQSRAASGSAMNASRTFALNGGTLIVDAPDSLRIVTDEQGRTLLIYTSDGLIRIRLAD